MERWTNLSCVIEHDPDLNRLMPTAGNGYGFYADLYGPEYAEIMYIEERILE